ncbi:MAG: FtsK/SpoIIIE domain-containing protein [Actinomycetes bacterium]
MRDVHGYGGYGRVGAPPVVQRYPVDPRPPETRSYSWLTILGRPLWSWRIELTTALLGLYVWHALAGIMHEAIALVLMAVAGAGLSRIGRVRRAVRWVFRWSQVCRKWEKAVRHAGLATFSDRVPRPRRMRLVPAGERLKVRIPDGGRVTDLAGAAEAVAVVLDVRDVRVVRNPASARYADVTVIRRDPFMSEDADPWPRVSAQRCSLWEPVPVGADEDGEPVTITLPERNVLLGGEPGAGKSVAQSLLTATAALDPDVELFLFDGKQVELAPWAASAVATVGPDVAHAVDVLDGLRTDMDARYGVLLGEGRRKVSKDDGLPLRLVVVDELAYFLAMGDRKDCQAFATGIRDLVARGRAAGIIVVAATQKPSHEIVPTGLRDLFAFRWAMRCTTPQASDTVLGQGWASLGYTASDVDGAARGVGYLLHEGGQPVRCRSYLLDDDTLQTLSRRAADLRRNPTGENSRHPSNAKPERESERVRP